MVLFSSDKPFTPLLFLNLINSETSFLLDWHIMCVHNCEEELPE